MLSPKQRWIFQKIIPFGVIPALFSIMYSFLEKGILGDHPVYPSTGNYYEFNLIIPAVMSAIAGFIVGVFELSYLDKCFQKSSLSKKIFLKSLIYMLIISTTTLLISIVTTSYELGVSIFDVQVIDSTLKFLNDLAFWSIILYFTFAVVVCLFYSAVSDNIGQVVLLNFLTGKYHQPIEEERIFMFLDMKSSTTIAERLGHMEYFKMLKEYYADLSDPIINNGGELYLYVGDEVIVTWKLKKDIKDNNCLNCFFDMKSALENQTEKYQSAYGVVPTFKAGIHFGKVTVGEIGVIKKDITFSGDVLNTTARIQGLCNEYKVDLLLSEELLKILELGNSFNFQALGETELRGRNEKIKLCTVEQVIELVS